MSLSRVAAVAAALTPVGRATPLEPLSRGIKISMQVDESVTDDDLTFSEGKSEELFGRLAEKLGRKKEEIRAEIEKL